MPVYPGDTTKLHFTWSKAGNLPEVKYKWTLSNFTNTVSYTTWSNNSGSDSVFSIPIGVLDSFAAAWGANNVGDSIRCRWFAKAYSMFDSLSPQSSSFLLTLRRSVIGIYPISTLIPAEYYIEQNYPNPFNPVTKIKFGLPKSSYVKFHVYDILGQEIELLVNQTLEAGTYEIQWNGGKYPSGVYFYRIEAGSFTKTAKMILAK
jgi:hypothetical protein